MTNNYNFAIYNTNLNNIGMFNNGTLNYNITLPTKLDNNGQIEDREKFINDHKNAIKIIQWLEPFIVAIYGAPDVFSTMNNYKNQSLYSKSSQRCSISRYIGIGTYDTDSMKSGKILTCPIKEHPCFYMDYWWFTKFYNNNAYTLLDDIGYDINFNKHYNHGIEIRFFDHISDDKNIYESFEFIIYLMDHILSKYQTNNETNNQIKLNKEDLINPIKDPIWNNIILNVMIHGSSYNLTPDEINIYNNIFNIDIKKTSIEDVYYEIYWNLTLKYNKIYKSNRSYFFKPYGLFSKLTLNEVNSLNNNFNELNSELNNEIINNDIKYIDIQTYLEEINDKRTYLCTPNCYCNIS